MAVYPLAPLATEAVGNIMPGLVGQGGAGAFDLPGNSHTIGLPNHLPPNTYYQLPHPPQKGGLVFPQRKKKTKTKRAGSRKRSQKGGLGPLAVMAGLSLAPMLLNSLMPQQRRMPPQHRMPPGRVQNSSRLPARADSLATHAGDFSPKMEENDIPSLDRQHQRP